MCILVIFIEYKEVLNRKGEYLRVYYTEINIGFKGIKIFNRESRLHPKIAINKFSSIQEILSNQTIPLKWKIWKLYGTYKFFY